MSSQSVSLVKALKELLMDRNATTQDGICEALEKQGYEINQSKVSRLLRKVGAIKVVNTQGEVVYSLPREPAPPSMDTVLKDLIVDVVANEVMVVIFTSPGSASVVARVLDYHQTTTEILAAVAGDDTIFVVPRSIRQTASLLQEVRAILHLDL